MVPPPPADWTAHRRRAEQLREAHPFAAEVLTCYLALLDVWDDAAAATIAEAPEKAAMVEFAVARVLENVVRATELAGPEPLGKAVRALYEDGDAEACLTGWLAGDELAPVERYLGRATLTPVLMAVLSDVEEPYEHGCPRCGGPPQLSVRRESGDALVSAARQLVCARCAYPWTFSSSTCAQCGETTGTKRTIYAERHDGPVVERDEPATFAHLRVDSCQTCQRYLIDVDLGRDPHAVPEVDELAAIPLALYAADLGLDKVTPNLMGM
jgi:hypothetical protein